MPLDPPTRPDADVREATTDDLPVIADTLADAFADYRWTRWVLPADDYERRLRAVQLYYAERVGLPHGRVWVARDGAAVAVWTLPDVALPEELFTAAELVELHGDRGAVMARAEELLAPHRPQEPCWFLATVGVRRADQGSGLGRAVLAPGIAAAEASGHPAFLETADEGNVGFYRSLGFEVTAEVALPGDAPRVWCMLRRPRADKVAGSLEERSRGVF
ncbi:GNAT family N-acetyltransferase [Marinactinospora thermotolerans]|uniref:Predicted acetyltransferase n=1 Tax=Marinactinospora thermotolerans DSM 45154 TaxID=1122192 RepID=A0A1T4RAA1_9ACTN|nr:GNAT family N-acetyltransferase [Marinactinospora thermotolerans]SKA12932.1 Predicted acetyltransferase [Marinactinospora thermotolerans DSM 45154]